MDRSIKRDSTRSCIYSRTVTSPWCLSSQWKRERVTFVICTKIWYATWPCSEKVEFWPFDQFPMVVGGGGGGGRAVSAGKILLPCCFNLWFPLIWYATWPCSKKVKFWPSDPVGRGGGVCWQNICYHVAAFVIPFNLIYSMTMFWKSWTMTSPPRSGGGGCLRAKYLLPSCCIFYFISFDMQLYHVLQKKNFDLLAQEVGPRTSI